MPMNKLRKSFFLKSTESWDNNILVSLRIDLDKFRVEDSQDQSSLRQESCCPKCLWTFKTNSLSYDSSTFWSRLYHSTKTNGKKSTHGRSYRKTP